MSEFPPQNQEHFLRSFIPLQPRLRSMVRSLLFSAQETDEVMQDISIILWQKFPSAKNFEAWAFAVARLEVIKFRQKKARERHVFSDELTQLLSDEAQSHQQSQDSLHYDLEHCLNQLAPDQRHSILAAYQKDNTIENLAKQENKTPMAFYKKLQRIRQILQQCILEQQTL
jgi:RNA polymerase sigma-70 factor (ECF subfamily)